MSFCTSILSITLWTALLATGANSTLAAETPETESLAPITRGVPINNGFVIVKGQYVPLPYVVGTREEELFLNDHPVETENLYLHRWGGRGFHRPWRSGPPRREPREEARSSTTPSENNSAIEEPDFQRRRYNHAARLERHLQENGLLVVFQDGTASLLPRGHEVIVLKTLLADKTRDEKLDALVKLQTRHIESARWIELVDSLQPSVELSDRVKNFPEKKVAPPSQSKTQGLRLPDFVKFGITVIGIVLGAVALGSLLNYRPKSKAPWSEIDTDGDSIPMVIRNVVLVAVLSFFDLGCTLLAQGSLGFVEMNPIGSNLMENPVLLASFKVTSLAVGCTILLVLRRYRGAQLASWWLCMVCTILTFRWATYGTMLIA